MQQLAIIILPEQILSILPFKAPQFDRTIIGTSCHTDSSIVLSEGCLRMKDNATYLYIVPFQHKFQN